MLNLIQHSKIEVREARNGKTSVIGNRVLVDQPQFDYPTLLFLKSSNSMRFEGASDLSVIKEKSFVLERNSNGQSGIEVS